MSLRAIEPYLFQEVTINAGSEKFLGEIVSCVPLEYLTSFERETHYGDEEKALQISPDALLLESGDYVIVRIK